VEGLYPALGFLRSAQTPEGGVSYVFDLAAKDDPACDFIRVRNATARNQGGLTR